MIEKTPDVRREGSKFVALHRIYRDNEKGSGRILVSPKDKFVSAELVEALGLVIEERKPKANKARRAQGNK